jgi:hypothetical protein
MLQRINGMRRRDLGYDGAWIRIAARSSGRTAKDPLSPTCKLDVRDDRCARHDLRFADTSRGICAAQRAWSSAHAFPALVSSIPSAWEASIVLTGRMHAIEYPQGLHSQSEAIKEISPGPVVADQPVP